MQPKRFERKWRVLTETVKRAMRTDLTLRAQLAGLAEAPVNETLPQKFMDLLQENPTVEGVKEKFRDSLGVYLALPPVPDEQIKPDISNAPNLLNLEEERKSLEEYHTPEETERHIERLLKYQQKEFGEGINAAERQLVLQRYRFARDVKLLTLMASLLDQKDLIQEDEETYILPSGIKLYFNPLHPKAQELLMQPVLWEKRRQLKDRVYTIDIGGSMFLLKERKTARHKDTMKRGHVAGNTSLQEFQAARHFEELGVIQEKGFSVTWETPLACVQFPDGFEFSIYEYAEDLLPQDSARDEVTAMIHRHQEEYTHELETLLPVARKLMKDTSWRFPSLGGTPLFRGILEKLGLLQPGLSFDEFAEVKARKLMNDARYALSRITAENGYRNRDTDGYSYRILQKPEGEELQILGFDFEYYVADEDDKKDLKRMDESHWFYEVNFSSTWYAQPMPCALYLAMLAAEGVDIEKHRYRSNDEESPAA